MKTQKTKRRESVPRTFVRVNEEKFVEEIKKHPILYDSTLKDYKKNAYKNAIWKEIGTAMKLTDSECKKRWRSLRDAFVKNLKAHSEDDIRVTHWIHYKLLEFLLPYIDRNARRRIRTDEFIDDDDFDDDMTVDLETGYHEEKETETPITLAYVTKSELNDMIDEIHENGEEHSEQQEIVVQEEIEEQIEERVLIDDLEHQNDSDCSENKTIYVSMAHMKNEQELLLPTTSSNRKHHSEILEEHHVIDQPRSRTGFISECDSNEKFLLSCAPILRRMSTKKNHLARLKIQQILFEIEYDEKI